MKKIGIITAVCMLFLLSGCGKRFELVNMKEFTSLDGTYSIEADENYTVTDVEVDNWLALDSSDDLGSTLVVMQFPKTGGFWESWATLDDVMDFMEESYKLSDRKETKKPENEQLRNIQAYTYKMTEDDYTYEIYAVYGETDYAHYLFMYEEALVKRHSDDYFEKVCASFKENADAVEEKSASGVEMSDTVRWFNASNAILIAINGWDYQVYGGLEPEIMNQEIARQLLDNSWGVTDKASADEILDWLLSEGHRIDFVDEMEFLEEVGIYEVPADERAAFLMENFDVAGEEAEYYAAWYNRYEALYEDAASGWDYNRALSQLANFYLAGYYTLEEAFDASLEIAEMIQASFDSWDDYMESYFTGYEYWAGESSEERREVYEDLKDAADNPYSIDFNAKLEKSW